LLANALLTQRFPDYRQIRQQPCQTGPVVAPVDHHQDLRVTGGPLPGGDQPGHHLTQLGGGHRRQIITGCQAHDVQ
jgi:hypothetical protein